MAIIIAGPGQGLPPPQNLYPSELFGVTDDAPTNYLGLAAGQAIVLPAGRFFVDPGAVSVVQFLDPVTGIWRSFSSARSQPMQILSDGFTRRVANLTGCVASAIIAGGGTGFAQGTAQITSNVGGSTWQAIVGGSLSLSTISAPGAGYTVAPEVFIPAPPNPGIAAQAIATITNGTVSGVSITQPGAGYISAPKAVLLPSPFDPNAGSITPAAIVLALNATTATAITGALCTNNGAPLATISALTLTAAGGAGAGATITPVVMQTIIGATVVAGGGGFGVVANPPAITSTGGVPTAASAIGNASVELTNFKPRPAIIDVAASSVGLISAPVIVDGGLFAGTPTPVIIPAGSIVTTLASVTFTMGAAPDSVLLQPL